MSGGPAPASREHGWKGLVLALAAVLMVPLFPPLRAVLPIEHTMLLLVPAVAVCFLLGWWAGGRLILALIWVAFAAFVVAQPVAQGSSSYHDLARAWGLLFAGAFGVVCVLGSRKPFLPRALAATSLALMLGISLLAAGRMGPDRVPNILTERYGVRNQQTGIALQTSLRQIGARVPSMRSMASQGQMEETTLELYRLSALATPLYPALLALESIVVCALAWTLYHRLGRARIGAPIAPLRDFAFNDQLIWGFVAGAAIAIIPTLSAVEEFGLNLLLFFGALYALRGLAVLERVRKRTALMAGVIGFFLILSPRPLVAATAFGAAATALALLGVSDTWFNWRARVHRPS